MSATTGGALDPRGPVAETIADLWWLLLVVGVVVFLVFGVLLVAGLVRRAPEPADDEARYRRLIERWIGVGGVAMPAVVIIGVFGATLAAMRAVPDDAPSGALRVDVTAHQFWYEIHYPDTGTVTANELHVPVGRPVVLRLTSADVIHSFWVPELAGKLDMLPEGSNTLVLEADRPGTYLSRCAEFCGLSHAHMELVVVAEPAGAFDAWVADLGAFDEPVEARAQRGRQVFTSADCVSCHALRGASAVGADAPDLTTLPARRTIAAAALPNTRAALADFITDPETVKPGVRMPATELSDADLDALLDYLGVDG